MAAKGQPRRSCWATKGYQEQKEGYVEQDLCMHLSLELKLGLKPGKEGVLKTPQRIWLACIGSVDMVALGEVKEEKAKKERGCKTLMSGGAIRQGDCQMEAGMRMAWRRMENL